MIGVEVTLIIMMIILIAFIWIFISYAKMMESLGNRLVDIYMAVRIIIKKEYDINLEEFMEKYYSSLYNSIEKEENDNDQ